MTAASSQCEGPMIWFDVEGDEAIVECSCGFIVTTGNVMDEKHLETPLLREGC